MIKIISEKFKKIYYLYPQKEFKKEKIKNSINILVVGKTGVGKSTCFKDFINYIQGIKIEDNYRYYLSYEKNLQKEYMKITGIKKPICSNITDYCKIYNIESTNTFSHPIKIIDTPGFRNTRGNEYNNVIIQHIQKLFINEINNLHSICLIYKTNAWFHGKIAQTCDKIFSFFWEDIIKNITVVFTFVDDLNYIPTLKVLLDENSLFRKIMRNISDLPYFLFKNTAYFIINREDFWIAYNNNKKNFDKLLNCIFQQKKLT